MDEFWKFVYRKRIEDCAALSNGMWSAVTTGDIDGPAPSARSKHSATLIGNCVYLFGGRNGNVPLKDFWKYNLADGKWQQIQPSGDKPPCLQEHTAVAHKNIMYIFGGEIGFSAGTETPLWAYDLRRDTWRKIRARKGVTVPRGRRGHSALVHRGTMLIYGGYQDLRGSCSELWAFHFETESWHLISEGKSSNEIVPAPRHKHSAIIHDNAIWVYGGMTDLQERSDLWRWDIGSKTWSTFKLKNAPGPLHSHVACRLPGSMVVFGGERDGHPTNELWKFHFDLETWEKLIIPDIKPQPRSECVAFTISDLLLKDSPTGGGITLLENRMARTRSRTGDKSQRPSSSYLPQNRVSPCEKTYVFKPSRCNFTDGSTVVDTAQSYDSADRTSFLKEITKLSQLNLSRLSSHNKCNYTVLTTGINDSTESLLRQHSSVQETDSESTSTPTRSRCMIKSRSAYAIKRKLQETNVDHARNVPINSSDRNIMTREPISVPNFSTLTLPTPVLTPVEAARLVFVSDDENEDDEIEVKPCPVQTVKRGESYSSHLGYADNPLYEHITSGICPPILTEISNENVSTSDYASIETMNRLSTSSSSASHRDVVDGPFGFCNPNYMGPDIQQLLLNERKQYAKLLNTPDSVLEDALGRSTSRHMFIDEQHLELKNMANQEKRKLPPKCLELRSPPLGITSKNKSSKAEKSRASSASRAERKNVRSPTSCVVQHSEQQYQQTRNDGFVPLYIFVFGGKEHGQVTVFKRPISIWKLKLF